MAEEFVIRRAERRQAKLRMALAASSGGGKTGSGLRIARGIAEELLAQGVLQGTLEGKIGVIDTERQSAELYSDLVPFDVINLTKPYTVARYSAAMDALERAGCAILMLDSISHAWVGDGGVLALLNSVDDRKRFSSFGTVVNPAQDEFIDRILRSPCHIVVTMRSKTAWVLEQVEKNGRTVTQPRRIGLKPIQREGVEFEFTTLLDLDTETHRARVVKNRCPVFKDGGEPFLITVETGRALARWLLEGAPAPEVPVGGTPEERALAAAEAAYRACGRAENVPDLARAMEDGAKAIRAFKDVVPREYLSPLIADLVLVKDACKEALGGDKGAGATGAGDSLPPDVALALEGLCQQGGVDPAALVEALKVPALRALPEERLQEAARWVYHHTDVEPLFMPPALVSRGITFRDSCFDDMPDDIPF